MSKAERFHLERYKHPKTNAMSWRVSGYRPDGKRIRKNFKARVDALHYKAEIEKACETGAHSLALQRTALTDEQLMDAENAFKHANGVSLTETVVHHQKLITKVRDIANVSLDDAIRFFENHYRKDIQEITVYNAREAYISSRRNVAPATVEFQKNTTKVLLNDDPNRLLHRFTTQDIVKVLSKYDNPQSYRTFRNGINAFFNWAVRNRHCLENPCDFLDRVPALQTRIVILSLDEIKRLLKAATVLHEGAMASSIAILLFAGLRPSELRDLDSQSIKLQTKVIRIEGGKMRRSLKRVTDIPPVLTHWLKKYPFNGRPAGWRYKLRKLKEVTKAEKWVADVLRHTSISYQLERDQNMNRVALQNGTSSNMIEQHYREVIEDKSSVKTFWNLTPKAVEGVDCNLAQPDKPNWPDKAKLVEMVEQMPLTKVGKAIGVSDNAVRKRCAKLGIELPRRRG